MPLTIPGDGTPWSSLGTQIVNSVQGPLASLYQSSTQSIPLNTYTGIQFNAENFDTHGGHDPSTNNTRWVCPSGWAGYYDLSGCVMFASDGTGIRIAYMRVNGTTTVRGSLVRVAPVADGFGNAVGTPTITWLLAAGDYVELVALHTNVPNSAISTYVTDPYMPAMNIAFRRFA
jgi:hypothetical protein